MTPNRITPDPVVVTVEPNDAITALPLLGAHASARVRATARVHAAARVRVSGGGAGRMEGH